MCLVKLPEIIWETQKEFFILEDRMANVLYESYIDTLHLVQKDNTEMIQLLQGAGYNIQMIPGCDVLTVVSICSLRALGITDIRFMEWLYNQYSLHFTKHMIKKKTNLNVLAFEEFQDLDRNII